MAPLEYTVGGIAAEVSVFLFLITCTVVLRFVARRKQKTNFGVDDYLVIPAWLCFVAVFGLAIYGISKQFIGYPTNPKSPNFAQQIPEFAQVYWSAAWVSVLGLGCVRLSALFFYRRIFCSSNSWNAFGIITLIMIVLVILWMIGFFLLAILACGSQVWNIWNVKAAATCQNYNFLIGVAISSFVLDLIVLLLPIPSIWALHTNSTRRFAISAVFLMAAAGVGASCARMVRYTGEYRDGRESNEKDIFINNTSLYFYQTLELGLCSIAVNLPSLWYFLAGITPERIVRSIRSLVSIRSRSSSAAVASPPATAAKRSVNDDEEEEEAEAEAQSSSSPPSTTKLSREENGETARLASFPFENVRENYELTTTTAAGRSRRELDYGHGHGHEHGSDVVHAL